MANRDTATAGRDSASAPLRRALGHDLPGSGRAPAMTALVTPKPLHVLIVEDDPPVRAHAVRVVSSLGYQVAAVSGADAALAALAGDAPCDLLMTDVAMPGTSGGQLAQAARALRPSLPVLFVTGHTEDPLVDKLRREGSAIVLFKPYRRAALADAILRALAIV